MSKSRSQPPEGMRIVHGGVVAQGDWAFASKLGCWKPLQATEVGRPVSGYVAVARTHNNS